jgi:nucleotide-binding universal stress UspA family protein
MVTAFTLGVKPRGTRPAPPVDLTVLHVNLYQKGSATQKREITRAVSETVDGVNPSVMIRQGYLVEEEILKEATQLDADIIVVGAKQQTTWRKILSRVLSNDPEIGGFLRENATANTKIMEVDRAAQTTVIGPM